MLRTSRQSGPRFFLATCALVAPLVFAVVPSVRAQEPPTTQNSIPDKIVTIEVRDARLESTVAALMSQNGLNNIVVVNEPGKSFGMVTIHLVDQPLRKVLQAIATSAGAVLKEEDGIFYLRQKSERDDPKPEPKTAPQPPTPAVVAPAAKPKPRQLARIPLIYMQPSIFVKMLDDPAYLAIAETMVPSYKEAITIGNPGSATVPFVEHMQNTNNGNPNNGNSNNPNAPTTPPVSGASGSGAGRDGGEAGARGQGFGRGGVGAGGAGGFGQGPGGGGAGGFGQGAGGGAGGQNGQGSLRPPGILNIIASDAQNALVVEYDDVDDLNRLREIIRLLDVAPQQVQVRAEFVAVNISDADTFGIDWRFQPAGNLDVAVPPESGTQPTVTMAYASGNAVANLRASLIRTTQNVLQAPIISTINNRPATINFATTVSIPQTTNIVGANGQIVSGTTFIPITANNGLQVTPHVNGDGTITMFLSPTLATVDLQAGGGFSSTQQSLTTTRQIRNGETMVLGGFITKQENREIRKVPILADLPIIGNLFQQKSRRVVGSEVLVFVTATIIDEGGNNSTRSVGGVAAPNPAPNP